MKNQEIKTTYILNNEQWEAFIRAIDAHPKENNELCQALNKKAPWEK